MGSSNGRPDPAQYRTGEVATTTWSFSSGGKRSDEMSRDEADRGYQDAAARGERPVLFRTDLVKVEYTHRYRHWRTDTQAVRVHR